MINVFRKYEKFDCAVLSRATHSFWYFHSGVIIMRNIFVVGTFTFCMQSIFVVLFCSWYIMIIYSKSHSILIDLLCASVFLARLLFFRPLSLTPFLFFSRPSFIWEKKLRSCLFLTHTHPVCDSMIRCFFLLLHSLNFFSSIH